MPKSYEEPDIDLLNLSDSDPDNLFDTPAQLKSKGKGFAGPNGKPTEPPKTRTQESPYDAEESRDAALRQELENIRKINEVIEGVVESLEKAKNNMDTVSRTVNSASTLLQTWTRILSQTEHNQRLILNPQWQGATRDLADIEAEEIQRQRDAQRRQVEDQQRREAAARKAEEDERRKEEAATRGSRGSRGRVRGTGRAGSSVGSSSNYVGVGGQGGRGVGRGSTTGTSRTGTTIGRGLRGRGRGLG